MTRRLTPEVRAGLVLAALAVVLFWRVFFRGETLIASDVLAASPVWRNPPGEVRNRWLSDTVEYYYPAEKFYSESIRRGELPLTNPYLFNGAPVPHGAHIWNSVWPVKLAFLFAFDPVRSYDFFAIFHWWAAGVAFFALARGRGVRPFAAFAGALAYALSGRAMLWLHGHYLMPTMAYVPLAFLWAGRPLAALPVAGLFFTNPQIALAAAVALFAYDRRSWKAVLIGGLMAAVALVPLFDAVGGGMRSPRGEAGWFYRDGWRCWLMLAGLVAPDVYNGPMPPNEYNIYVGLLPLAGALFALRRERFFAALAGIALAAGTLYPLPVLLSPVSFSLPTRYLFFFTFGACVCFARALDRVELRPWMKGAVLLLVLVDLAPRFARWNGTYDPAVLRERPAAADVLRGGRVGWILSPHPAFDRPVLPPLWLWGIPSVQGYDVTVPRAHVEALKGAADARGDRTLWILDPDHPALEAAGMRYLLADRPIRPERLKEVHAGSVWIYMNSSAPEVPPRRARTGPVWLGLALTLGACAAAVLGACLDRARKGGYS